MKKNFILAMATILATTALANAATVDELLKTEDPGEIIYARFAKIQEHIYGPTQQNAKALTKYFRNLQISDAFKEPTTLPDTKLLDSTLTDLYHAILKTKKTQQMFQEESNKRLKTHALFKKGKISKEEEEYSIFQQNELLKSLGNEKRNVEFLEKQYKAKMKELKAEMHPELRSKYFPQQNAENKKEDINLKSE